MSVIYQISNYAYEKSLSKASSIVTHPFGQIRTGIAGILKLTCAVHQSTSNLNETNIKRID